MAGPTLSPTQMLRDAEPGRHRRPLASRTERTDARTREGQPTATAANRRGQIRRQRPIWQRLRNGGAYIRDREYVYWRLIAEASLS
jgi:hypothetical protein